MKRLFTIIMGLALTACGGGDSGGGSSSAPTPTVQSPKPERMQDLVVPHGFSYDPIVQGTLNVNISSFSSQRAHLSVYKEYKQNSSGGFNANYTSRIASAALKDGKTYINYTLSDSQGDLLVEVWFYDGTEPLQAIISPEEKDWIL
ncbi:hypothetical protein VA249_31230 [Vibrio alfacsensis]|uniref:hypothetical protein n=1 Tax=Vibrio alfacsensis TaxID=1074311 RepID=UPI001BF1866B|nr:hypothetical protein [Vibrio alfacsensis]BBM66477.1 hypothetical protein VA249_31230 [Vibrio alfacsensis]